VHHATRMDALEEIARRCNLSPAADAGARPLRPASASA
jgi:hypothetical protein